MREISTEEIKIGEHVMIDGVVYVAKYDGHSCRGCAFIGSGVCEHIPCRNCIMVKVEKQPIKEQKKYTPMTLNQLAEWLAKGHGRTKYRCSRAMFSDLTFYEGDENEAVKDLVIRPWGTDEWVKPTLEIYERDCR